MIQFHRYRIVGGVWDGVINPEHFPQEVVPVHPSYIVQEQTSASQSGTDNSTILPVTSCFTIVWTVVDLKSRYHNGSFEIDRAGSQLNAQHSCTDDTQRQCEKLTLFFKLLFSPKVSNSLTWSPCKTTWLVEAALQSTTFWAKFHRS